MKIKTSHYKFALSTWGVTLHLTQRGGYVGIHLGHDYYSLWFGEFHAV